MVMDETDTCISLCNVYSALPGDSRSLESPETADNLLAVSYSNTVALNTGLFTRYVRRDPSKKINTKKLPESFLDASESHKTSANLSVRAYFRQFSDW